ncbi:MAG: ABC transporter substrate-binding protein, partial [Nanoarchaeota archaeon]
MKLKIFIITFLFILLVGVYTFAEGEILDSNIPDSWYEAPKTASEMGINKFDQSPTLDTAVEEGELPPVEERLPEDPPVIEPYEKVGEYGGVINVWSTSLGLGNDAEFAGNMPAIAGRPAPDGTKTLPYFLKDWEFSDDYTEITIYLRKGIKFSDGTPLTADDYLYWWEHEANNEDLEPVPPEDWKPAALLDVEKIDNHTVKYSYEKPYPKIDDFEFKYNMGPGVSGEIVSANYMKQFHPNFVEEQKIVEMAKDVDLDNWDEYYSRIRDDSPEHPEYERQRPVLRPYIAVERSETRLVLERNPYYPFVDTEGNQLPYVDEIVVNLANDDEMARTKAVTGEATFASRFLMPENIPLYKQNEEKENYSTLLYRRAYGSDIPIQLNLTHKNDNLREIFQNKKFRQALSIAIDRENINNKIYFGEAEP